MKALIALTFFTFLFGTYQMIISPSDANASSKCKVYGLNPKSHHTLKTGLCALSNAYGSVVITNKRTHQNCRTRGDRTGKANSWHKYHRGCRAADIRVRGVSPWKVKRWWLNYTKKQKGVLGAAHVYRSGFVHVDTRTNGARTW